jgi:hypothetical protein
MGVLAQAKNGDKQFWKWEGLACTRSALIFFLLSFGWAWEGFFHFSFVPNMFPSSSQYVP